jgi:hypothetical protein
MQLFANQTANGSSPAFTHKGSGALNLYVGGVVDAAAITVEAQLPDSSGWVALDGGTVNSAGMFRFSASPFIGRITLSGAGLSTNVSVWAEWDDQSTARRLFNNA